MEDLGVRDVRLDRCGCVGEVLGDQDQEVVGERAPLYRGAG